jgi:hypothetical protein
MDADLESSYDVLRAREAQWRRPGVTHLKPSLRKIIARWMREEASDVGMHPRTAMLAISFLDRFASASPVAIDDMERLAIACLWVAAKYEEVKVFKAQSMLEMSVPTSKRPAMTASDLTGMEGELLRALDHRLSIPTPFDFLEALCYEAWGHVPPLREATDMILRHMIRQPPAIPPSELAATALVAASTKVPVPVTLVDPVLVAEMRR